MTPFEHITLAKQKFIWNGEKTDLGIIILEPGKTYETELFGLDSVEEWFQSGLVDFSNPWRQVERKPIIG